MAAWGSAAREASLPLFLRSVGNRTLRRRSLSAGGSPVKIPGTKPWQPEHRLPFPRAQALRLGEWHTKIK